MVQMIVEFFLTPKPLPVSLVFLPFVVLWTFIGFQIIAEEKKRCEAGTPLPNTMWVQGAAAAGIGMLVLATFVLFVMTGASLLAIAGVRLA